MTVLWQRVKAYQATEAISVIEETDIGIGLYHSSDRFGIKGHMDGLWRSGGGQVDSTAADDTGIA